MPDDAPGDAVRDALSASGAPGRTVKWISRFTGLSEATVQAELNVLREAGVVERVHDGIVTWRFTF